MSFSPNLGRWTQLDPIGFEGGDSNLYRYEGNSTLTGLDPMGLACAGSSDWLTIVAGTYGGPSVDNDDWGWGDNSRGNCYSFAMDTPLSPYLPLYSRHGAAPGFINGDCTIKMTCAKIDQGIMKDTDGKATRTTSEGVCPRRMHKIAAYCDEDSGAFHFYRQNPNGTWCQKDLFGKVSCTTKDGNPIKSLDAAERERNEGFVGRNFKPCGFYCVPDKKAQSK